MPDHSSGAGSRLVNQLAMALIYFSTDLRSMTAILISLRTFELILPKAGDFSDSYIYALTFIFLICPLLLFLSIFTCLSLSFFALFLLANFSADIYPQLLQVTI